MAPALSPEMQERLELVVNVMKKVQLDLEDKPKTQQLEETQSEGWIASTLHKISDLAEAVRNILIFLFILFLCL